MKAALALGKEALFQVFQEGVEQDLGQDFTYNVQEGDSLVLVSGLVISFPLVEWTIVESWKSSELFFFPHQLDWLVNWLVMVKMDDLYTSARMAPEPCALLVLVIC